MIRIRFVARHLIAKADDQVIEGVTDNYYDSRCVNYVSCVCYVLLLRALRWTETPPKAQTPFAPICCGFVPKHAVQQAV